MTALKARIEIDLPVPALAAHDIDWPTDLAAGEPGGEPAPPPTISLFEGDDPACSVVEIFAPGPLPGAELAIFLSRLGAAAGRAVPVPRFEPLPERDWVAESQRLRRPVDAGRFTICEAHQRAGIAAKRGAAGVAAAREIIVIEAGQAFGTGGHESTRGCLMALDALADEISPKGALDLGTGSGVLAIAMARLWKISVLASDIDPVAGETAAANIAANRAEGGAAGIEIVIADGVGDPLIAARAPYGLITANILAAPLIALAPDIALVSAPGAVLVLSGVTREQAAGVEAAYGKAGFAAKSRVMLGDWCTMILARGA